MPMTSQREGTFRGAGGLEIHHVCWSPEPDPVKATVIVAHGVAEHSGRYHEVAADLVARGYEVWALDHRGHGRSAGRRGHVEHFSAFVADLETFRLRAVQAAPDRPAVLLGHSMGGAIALAHAIAHPDVWNGLVLSGPAVEPGRGAGAALVAVGKVLARVLPTAGVVQLDGSTISRDPSVVDAYRNDPLVHTGKLSARLGAELLAAAAGFPQGAATLRLPVLIVHGDDDRLVDVEGSRRLLGWLGSSDKTLREYAGLYHEVFNEPERDQVLDDVAGWLDERVDGWAAGRAGG